MTTAAFESRPGERRRGSRIGALAVGTAIGLCLAACAQGPVSDLDVWCRAWHDVRARNDEPSRRDLTRAAPVEIQQASQEYVRLLPELEAEMRELMAADPDATVQELIHARLAQDSQVHAQARRLEAQLNEYEAAHC